MIALLVEVIAGVIFIGFTVLFARWVEARYALDDYLPECADVNDVVTAVDEAMLTALDAREVTR